MPIVKMSRMINITISRKIKKNLPFFWMQIPLKTQILTLNIKNSLFPY